MLEVLWQLMPLLLKLYWSLAAGSVIVTLLPVPLPLVLKDAVRLSAARGKLWDTKPCALGALQDVSVPQSWFSHFYLIGTICNACSLALLAVVCGAGHPKSACTAGAWISLLAFQGHLVRRLVETLVLMRYPRDARMHIIAYVFAVSYYVVAPLSLLPEAAFDQQLLQAVWKQHKNQQMWHSTVTALPAHFNSLWQDTGTCMRVVMLAGVLIFSLGNLLQLQSHSILAALSRSPALDSSSGPLTEGTAPAKQTSSVQAQGASKRNIRSVTDGFQQGSDSKAAGMGTKLQLRTDKYGNDSRIDSSKGNSSSRSSGGHTTYKVPHGGMFDLVSCPHYLAEIVIYVGLWLASGLQVNPALMLLWVVVNLILAAEATHSWYRQNFVQYPVSRRALIPWLF